MQTELNERKRDRVANTMVRGGGVQTNLEKARFECTSIERDQGLAHSRPRDLLKPVRRSGYLTRPTRDVHGRTQSVQEHHVPQGQAG